MKKLLIFAIIASFLGGCSWVQSMRGIPPPTPKTKVAPKTAQHPAVKVVPTNNKPEQSYMEQRQREIFSLAPPKQKRRAIEGANEVERAALKEVYDDMDSNLDKNRNKVFSF